MNAIWTLSRRNLSLFFRDRMGVFFSLLSALILFLLYAFFLGQQLIDSLHEQFPQATAAQVEMFINSWVFAGITMITSLTTGLAALSVFVEDRASGRFQDFLVSPLRRVHLILGYLLSTFVIAVVMTLVVLAVGQLYLSVGGGGLSAAHLGQVLLSVLLSSAVCAAISSCVVTFVASNGAFSALSTIVGTGIGFLAGAYIPIGVLPEAVGTVMNALPFGQAAMLFRRPFTADSLDTLAGGNAPAIDTVQTFYGITGSLGGVDLTTGIIVASLATVGVVFVLLGSWRIGRTIR
ncbi:ABC transporter permease [Klugiella xanthotipulae]|uniref:Transport permease protein n=1 Tax=Klugiella xanthotipulae TaxID=244735 RepID=A0A543I5L7_9MICO|nr:ABC transporter permease [Klugiella xanthotipulae]TQM65903.1 multidrug/hemolysin transport system permease protein [Klugiella xanthotipulae]